MKDLFFENLIITVIMTIGAKIFSIWWKAAKNEFNKQNHQKSRTTYVKSTVRIQFFTALSLGLLIIILFPLIPEGLKYVAGLIAFISFIAVWGCFDVACEFWTNDYVDKPVDNHSSHETDQTP